ncbi:MAG: hypothetical protein HQM02_03380 [Magnetococcales bacterium]|nr:hypothetical protein [Magnetococcales bacterium]
MPASFESRTPPGLERRYVDFRIQMRMLIALVLLETGLAGGGVGYLYFRFKAIIEENLYRIHHGGQSVFQQLLEETGWVVLVMLVVNLAGLLIADRLWVGYVQRVLGSFTALAVKVTDLDFRSDGESPDQHASLELMLSWRQKERDRALAVRELVRDLDQVPPARQVERLRRLRAILPPYSRRFVGRLASDRDAARGGV